MSYIKIVPATFLTASSAQYGASPNSIQAITRAVFSNTDTINSHTITVNIVPSGGTVSTGNQIINAYTLQPNQTYVSTELAGYILVVGDQIFASCSAQGVINMTINGVQ